MQYSAGFVAYLLQAEHSIAPQLGSDAMTADPQTYRINLLTLSLIGMVMKAIQDLHPTVVTDAVWQQRLNTAIDTGPAGARDWPGWIILQIPPELLAQYGATTSDSVAQLQAKIDAYNAGQNAVVAQQTNAAH